MAYEVKYRCEFDTIKGRQVKIDIEEDREIPPATLTPNGIVGVYGLFTATLKRLRISGRITYIEKGDIFVITGTTNNNLTLTIADVYYTSLYATPEYTDFFFVESIFDETATSSYNIAITQRQIINIIASGQSPLEINYPNGEFDKTCPIRESKVRFKILTNNVTYEDFVIQSDTQYKVKIYINGTVEWLGWLDNDYVTEPFLDIPVELELSANDGLSILKTTTLQTQSADQMWGNYKVKEFIANALYQTKLNLDIYTYINMYPIQTLERDQDQPASYDYDAFFYASIYATTFLKGPRDFDDSYEVLSKIMQSFNCTLYQARGKWYIIQTNDRIANVLDGTIRDYTGNATAITMNQSFKIDIGLNEVTKLINADALISIEKPFKEVAVKHSFDVPPIYFRNWDLLDVDGISPKYWTAANSPLAEFYGYNNTGYIQSDIEAGTGAEIRRYMVLPGRTNSPFYGGGAKRSTIYPINKGDKVTFGFSIRYNNPYFRWGDNWCYVVFQSESGQFYYLDLDGKWYIPFRSVGYSYNKNEDRRFWKSYTITSEGVPGNGNVSIILTGTSRELINASHDIYYKDLEFSIETSFNDMTEVDGYEYKCETTENIKNKYDNEIFISNSPNISTQGSILKLPYENRPNWHYKGDDANYMPFAKYITRTYWRTMYRKFMRLEGRLYDLYQGNRLLSPLNTVEFTEVSNKEFMLTTLQMDIRQESAEFTMIELRNTTDNTDFTENGIESFRYINVKAKDENNPVKEPKTPIDWRFGTIGVISSLLRRKKRRRFNNYS
jgi:hypothetical protein